MGAVLMGSDVTLIFDVWKFEKGDQVANVNSEGPW